jgi:ketosteroid isomerase-like protein
MKKIILLLTCATLFYSCDKTTTLETVTAPKEIGFQISDKGEKIPLYGGDMAAVSLWETYIKAHNERDLETIAALNAEKDFIAYAPNGKVIKGTEAHLELLTTWFEKGTNPTWTTKFLITNMYTNKEGKVAQWVTSGHDLTEVIDGKEVKFNQVHDGLIVDGKIKQFSVNERVLASEQEEEQAKEKE